LSGPDGDGHERSTASGGRVQGPTADRPVTELVLGGLALRPVWETDEERYTSSQAASHEHLARFEGWAQAVPTRSATRAWFELCREGWKAGHRFVYGAFEADDPCAFVGSVGLHVLPDDVNAFTIGYWTLESAGNRGHATLGAAALTWAAFQLGHIERVEVHCDAANAVSARIPRRLGFELVGTRSRALTAPAQLGRDLVFSCTRSTYPRTYAHRLWVEQRRTP
jgi:RimJ/RimL family protein N-acetyltransferase